MESNDVLAIATAFTALATTALAIITGLLALFARNQISSALYDAKIGRTLAVCEKYDLDPQLGRSVARLRRIRDSGDLKSNPDRFYNDIVGVLNYFESIAIGLERNLYDKDIVKDNFEEIFRAHYVDYFGKNAPKVIREKWFLDSDFKRFKRISCDWTRNKAKLDKRG